MGVASHPIPLTPGSTPAMTGVRNNRWHNKNNPPLTMITIEATGHSDK